MQTGDRLSPGHSPLPVPLPHPPAQPQAASLPLEEAQTVELRVPTDTLALFNTRSPLVLPALSGSLIFIDHLISLFSAALAPSGAVCPRYWAPASVCSRCRARGRIGGAGGVAEQSPPQNGGTVSCPTLPALPHPPNCSTEQHQLRLCTALHEPGRIPFGGNLLSGGVGGAPSESRRVLMGVGCRICQAAGGASSAFLCCL